MTPTNSEATIGKTLIDLAQVFAALPERPDVTWLKNKGSAMRKKARAGSKPSPPPHSTSDLLAAGRSTMDRSRELLSYLATCPRQYLSERSVAIDFANSLNQAIISLIPLRRRNQHGLVYKISVLPKKAGYRICFPRRETKAKCIVRNIPAVLLSHTSFYIQRVVNILGIDKDSLSTICIKRNGAALTKAGLAYRFNKQAQRSLGAPMSMHKARNTASNASVSIAGLGARININTPRIDELYYRSENSPIGRHRIAKRIGEVVADRLTARKN